MLTYIVVGVSCLIMTLLYRIETHKSIKNVMVNKYYRWKELNNLVSTTETNKLNIFMISMKLIIQTVYIAFLQYINKTVRKIGRNTYEISYVIDGKLFKMIVISKRGPTPILQISDDKQNDVTEQILPYMGPQYDWHNTHFSPEFFGTKSLIFELLDGTEYTYEEKTNLKPI